MSTIKEFLILILSIINLLLLGRNMFKELRLKKLTFTLFLTGVIVQTIILFNSMSNLMCLLCNEDTLL